MTKLELVGKRFGKLVVLSEVKISPKYSYWNCLCDCGVEKTVKGKDLNYGLKSCGCLRKEQANISNTKHGKHKSTEYYSWGGMKARCSDTKLKSYKDYGGRGISVCERWTDFKNFLQDMGTKPPNTSLERIDNDKGYSTDNCKWGTKKEQQLNRRINIQIEYNGEVLRMNDIVSRTGITYATISGRYRKGWSAKQIMETPRYKHPNKALTDAQLQTLTV